MIGPAIVARPAELDRKALSLRGLRSKSRQAESGGAEKNFLHRSHILWPNRPGAGSILRPGGSWKARILTLNAERTNRSSMRQVQSRLAHRSEPAEADAARAVVAVP